MLPLMSTTSAMESGLRSRSTERGTCSLRFSLIRKFLSRIRWGSVTYSWLPASHSRKRDQDLALKVPCRVLDGRDLFGFGPAGQAGQKQQEQQQPRMHHSVHHGRPYSCSAGTFRNKSRRDSLRMSSRIRYAGRYQDQGDHRGEQHPERQGDRHRHQEPGLHAFFEEQRQQPDECGQGCQDDRPEPGCAGQPDRRLEIAGLPEPAVDEVHHYQAVVHHHAGQGDDAEQGQDRQVHPHEHMAPDRPHQAERDGQHDDYRLNVRAQRDGQQGEDHDSGQGEPPGETAHSVTLLRFLTFEREEHTRVIGQDLRQYPGFQIGCDVVGGSDLGVDIGGDVHRPAAIHPPDGGVPAAEVHCCHLVERQFGAVRSADPHVLHISQGTSFLRRIAHHDPDIVTTALDALGFFAVERLPDLSAQIGLSQAKGFGLGLDPQLDLFLPFAEGVCDLRDAGVLRETLLDCVCRRLQLRGDPARSTGYRCRLRG